MALASLRPVGSLRKSSHLIWNTWNLVASSCWSACSITGASNQSQLPPVIMKRSMEVQPYSPQPSLVPVQGPAVSTEPFMRISRPTYLERSFLVPVRLMRSVPTSLESEVLVA